MDAAALLGMGLDICGYKLYVLHRCNPLLCGISSPVEFGGFVWREREPGARDLAVGASYRQTLKSLSFISYPFSSEILGWALV